jgi:dolichyl-phosphate beta-glucosyltransferase
VSAERLPVVVVPCYNEERRLDPARLGPLASSGRLQLLFVDDGSTDGTAAVLGRLRDTVDGVDVLALPRNVGKAEAIRRGLVQGIETGAPIVGYYDADLATPPEELVRMVDLLESRPDLEFVMAARVALLGRHIRRRATRHYLGRVFATFASLTLHIPVYDTQCGAKVFRASPAVRAAVAHPFRSSWVFDVELIGRLLRGTGGAEPVPLVAFEEMPLLEWRDVSGSRLRIRDMARAFADLLAVAIRLHRPDARRKD